MTDEIDEEELRSYLCETHDHWASYPCPYCKGGLVSHTPTRYWTTRLTEAEQADSTPVYKAREIDPLLARVEELEALDSFNGSNLASVVHYRDAWYQECQSLKAQLAAMRARVEETEKRYADDSLNKAIEISALERNVRSAEHTIARLIEERDEAVRERKRSADKWMGDLILLKSEYQDQLAALRASHAKLEEMLGLCIAELRTHVFCGDAYPENGWPTVNKVLAEYAKFKRDKESP